MTLRTLAIALLLAASALALVPSAQAAEADPCPAFEAESLAGGVTIAYNPETRTCESTVGVIDGHRVCSAFAGFDHHQVSQGAGLDGASGNHHARVVVNFCLPQLVCTCDPIEPAVDPQDVLDAISTGSAAMQPPIYCIREPCYPPGPAISWCKLENATPEGQLRNLLWGTDEGCDIDVDTNWYCIYNEVPVETTVGPVHVTTRICTPPMPPIEPALG